MSNKKSAVQVGRPYTADQDNVQSSTVLSVRLGKHVVKLQDRLFDILGGLVLGAGIAALSIMIPILLGGY